MPAITADELSNMRDHAEEYLAGTCTIQYDSGTTVKGKHVPGWTNRGTAILCRFDTVSNRDLALIQGGQVQEGRLWMVTLKHDETVAITDRIYYGGAYYHPIWINDDEIEKMVTRVVCQRMN